MGGAKCVVCARAGRHSCSRCQTSYCSVECQTRDWRELGHRAACARLVRERGGAVVTPPEARARATAAAAAAAARGGGGGAARCPACDDAWDVNREPTMMLCCARDVCDKCSGALLPTSLPCPLCGTPASRDAAWSLALLRRHVDGGHPAAIAYLGCAFRAGYLGLVPSRKKAAKFYRRAADLGDVRATLRLGAAYAAGEGVKLDRRKAARYYRVAADAGDALAQCELGYVLHEGLGVDRDAAEAARYLRLAANAGLAEAEFNLGAAYEAGSGVDRDRAEAERLYARAAARGHRAAAATVDRIAGLRRGARSGDDRSVVARAVSRSLRDAIDGGDDASEPA